MNRLPTEDEESWFWSLIEFAWERTGAAESAKRSALIGRAGDDVAYGIDLDAFLFNLRELCEDMSAAELTDLDRVLERKLYDLDRADIQQVTDGGDDGFLYCRGFIVAMGREFHDAVVADPAVAVLDAECEEMCYFFAHLHDKYFGGFTDTESGISRGTTSNKAGWR